MNIRRKLRAHGEVHTGPLNDILFILLLFFLIAATLANPNLVQVNNPQGTRDTEATETRASRATSVTVIARGCCGGRRVLTKLV